MLIATNMRKVSKIHNHIFKWGSSNNLYPRSDPGPSVWVIAGTHFTLFIHHLGYAGELSNVEMFDSEQSQELPSSYGCPDENF